MGLFSGKRTRLKLTWISALAVIIIGFTAIFFDMSEVTLSCVASLTLIIERYLTKETNIPSVKREIERQG